MELTNIYILRLGQNKFYIGSTKDVPTRFQSHLNGTGSVWTKIYKPIEIIKVIPNTSPFDEDKYVKEYMSIYGINNVRGGVYVKEILEKGQIESLQKEIWGAKGLCIKCGSNKHWVKDCNIDDKTIEKKKIENNKIKDIKTFDYNKPKKLHCYKCNRDNHSAKNCYATTIIDNGIVYEKKIYCYRCGRDSHLIKDCYANTDHEGKDL